MTEDRLEGRVVDAKTISNRDMEQMFGLLDKHFDGYTTGNFQKDLAEKDSVLILRDPSGAIRGFTTMLFMRTSIDEEPIRGVFSGDTIVDKEYWGHPTLMNVWSRHMIDASRKEDTRFYWFLICSGYRTYRFLPTLFKEFYPRHDKATPSFEQRVIDNLASMKFGKMYDPETGLIRFLDSQERLKPELSHIPEEKLSNPHIRYFADQNPESDKGVELACIAEISIENYRPSILRRFFNETEQR